MCESDRLLLLFIYLFLFSGDIIFILPQDGEKGCPHVEVPCMGCWTHLRRGTMQSVRARPIWEVRTQADKEVFLQENIPYQQGEEDRVRKLA